MTARAPRFAELDRALMADGYSVHAPAQMPRPARRRARRPDPGVRQWQARRERKVLTVEQRRAKYLRETGRFEQLQAEGLA